MLKILIKFWPAFVPIVLYMLWFLFFRKKKDTEKVPAWEAKLWVWTLATALVIAILCIVVMAFSVEQNTDSDYVPAYMEDGELVPGKLVPKSSE